MEETQDGLDILSPLFTKLKGDVPASYENISSHGSDRKIYRLFAEDDSTLIGIYNQNLSENKAFIGYGNHFKQAKMNVPEIYEVSDDMHAYITEDLGDETLLIRLQKTRPYRFSDNNINAYKSVISELIKFQTITGTKVDYSLCYQYDSFAKENIEYDLNYFKERFLINFHKEKFDEALLTEDLNHLRDKILELPQNYFLYRDFQSRNIMMKDDLPYFIDFQSGRKGALQYDLASLLYDAKAEIPQDLREYFINHYIDEVNKVIKIDKQEFINYYWYFVLIRILQALGAYGFLSVVKGKQRFLESVPYALKNIDFILNHKIDSNEFTYLRKLFRELENETA